MKSKWVIVSVLIVALIFVCLAGLFATWQGVKMAQGTGIRIDPVNWSVDQVTAEATDEKKLEVSGPVNLTLETYQGNITVEAGEDNQVTIKTKTTTWGSSETDAQDALKDITVKIDQQKNDIKISIDQAIVVDMLHIGPRGGRVDFTITVPAQTAVMLNSTQGDLSLTGTTGTAQLKTAFGNISLKDITGEITAASDNGEINAQKIGSKDVIKLSSQFGAIKVDDVKGTDITISTANGTLDPLKNIHASGLLKITSEFGDIKLTDGKAKTAEIKTKNGMIDLENVDVNESINAKSDFGNLTLSKVLATSIDLSSNNGSIRFSGSLGSGPHSISSNFGNISVTLPAESALTLELKTNFGKITSNFSITVSGTMESNHWTGTINGGGAALNIKTQNGNINLQSAK